MTIRKDENIRQRRVLVEYDVQATLDILEHSARSESGVSPGAVAKVRLERVTEGSLNDFRGYKAVIELTEELD